MEGRRGTALLSRPDDAAFARGFVSALAEAGDAAIHTLELDGHPVSAQVVLRAGAVVYTWKTAYDEALGDCSPGMLLFEDCSKAFLADRSIAFANSCAFDESSYMAAWTERKPVVDFWFDARRGPSMTFAAVARAQKAYLPLREAAKQAYLKTNAVWARLGASAASLRNRLPGAAARAPAADRFAPGSR